jgi:glycosyltransferase involved in cell wall biosynthesis
MGAIGIYRGYASGLQHSMRLHGAFVAHCLRQAFPDTPLAEAYDQPRLFRGAGPRDAASLLYKIDRYLLPRNRFRGARLDLLVISDHSDGYVSFLTAARRKVIICHDLLPKLLELGRVEGPPPSALGRALLYVNGRALSRADLVVCVSESTRQDAIEFFGVEPGKAIVIHNCPLVDQEMDEAADQIRPEVAKALADPRPYVLSIGGGKFYKNLTAAPHVLRMLVASGVDARWIIVGDADFDPHREDLDGRVTFVSRLNAHEMRSLFERGGVLFFPSLYEGFGLPIVEAQMYGLPVVCSDRGSAPEVAGVGAIVVSPHEYGEAADAIRSVLTDAAVRGALIAAGRRNVARFTRASRERAYQAAFRRVIQT